MDLDLLRQVDAFDKYVEDRGWVLNDPEISEYLRQIGLLLVPNQTPDNVVWRFRALRDPEVNAFALPNGSVYVNSGLLSRLENEAQLAGVLARLIAHVVNRHTYLEHRSMRNKAVAIALIQSGASAPFYPPGISPVITEGMEKLVPKVVDYTVFGYSREFENEADVYSVNALHAHGYELREFARGIDLLGNGPEVDFSSHPFFWSSRDKLADTAKYVNAMAEQLQGTGTNLLVNRSPYFTAAAKVIRRNAELAILLGRPRMAVSSAQRLTADEPNNSENYVLLGDAYRSLGARTPLAEPGELTAEGKEATRQLLRKMTMAEYEKALMAKEHGPEHWQANWDRSQKAYQKAIEMDPHIASAHRGLGYLLEANEVFPEAIEQFKTYLAMAPEAKDARQIRLHLEKLERANALAGTPPVKSRPVK